MCSRYRLAKEKIVLIIRGREFEITLHKRYNVAPRQAMPVLIPEPVNHPRMTQIPADLRGASLLEVAAVEMNWGWQPVWSKQLLINAQAETVLDKPTFKPWLHQRCLVPADGFYEWMPDKTPIMFTQPEETVFCFAGLWMDAPGQAQPGAGGNFLILTTSPNDSVSKVHNRMPLIVSPRNYGDWLFGDHQFPIALHSPDKNALNSRPVQRELNHVKNEGPDLIKAAPIQPSLF